MSSSIKLKNDVYLDCKAIHVERITGTFDSNNVANHDLDYMFIRIGNYILLKFNTIAFNFNGGSHGDLIISGLPKPKDVIIFLLNTGWSNISQDQLGRFAIQSNGSMTTHYAYITTTESFGGFAIYETTD